MLDLWSVRLQREAMYLLAAFPTIKLHSGMQEAPQQLPNISRGLKHAREIQHIPWKYKMVRNINLKTINANVTSMSFLGLPVNSGYRYDAF